MAEADKEVDKLEAMRQELVAAIDGLEGRVAKYIAGLRQHELVNLDAMVGDVKRIRRDVDWLKTQWEKFSRPTGEPRPQEPAA